MGTTPTADNKIVDFIDGLIQQLANSGVSAAEAYIAVQAPALEWPVIDIFTNEVLTAVADAVAQQTQAAVAKVVIDIQTNLESSAAIKAAQNLQAAQASGDPDAIAAANANFDSALSSLIHSDGSAAST